MAQCNCCGRSGLSLSLSAWGLCSGCHKAVTFSVTRHSEIIGDSLSILRTSRNCETIARRCEVIMENIRLLEGYKAKGIPLPTFDSIDIQFVTDTHDHALLMVATDSVTRAVSKAGKAKNPAT